MMELGRGSFRACGSREVWRIVFPFSEEGLEEYYEQYVKTGTALTKFPSGRMHDMIRNKVMPMIHVFKREDEEHSDQMGTFWPIQGSSAESNIYTTKGK